MATDAWGRPTVLSEASEPIVSIRMCMPWWLMTGGDTIGGRTRVWVCPEGRVIRLPSTLKKSLMSCVSLGCSGWQRGGTHVTCEDGEGWSYMQVWVNACHKWEHTHMHKLYMHTYVHTSAHSNAANSSLVKQCGSLISVTRLTSGLTHALAVLLHGMVLYMPTPRALGPVTVLTQVNPKALHATIPGGRRTDG